MRKGSHQSKEAIEKMRAANLGKRHSEETKRRMSIAGKGNPHNTPKRRIDNGYVRLYKPDHPMSDKSGYLLEHRFIMSEYLSRVLDSEELVHHIDQNTMNNSIENLKITNRCEHIGIHFDPVKHGEKIRKIRKEKYWSTKRFID